MPEKFEFYKGKDCNGIVMPINPYEGDLSCCGREMELLEEKTADFKNEKHVPVIEKVDGGIKVTVGSTLHPMAEEHHIEWIAIAEGDCFMLKYLKPGDEPSAIFPVENTGVKAFEHCNVHGLWTNKK